MHFINFFQLLSLSLDCDQFMRRHRRTFHFEHKFRFRHFSDRSSAPYVGSFSPYFGQLLLLWASGSENRCCFGRSDCSDLLRNTAHFSVSFRFCVGNRRRLAILWPFRLQKYKTICYNFVWNILAMIGSDINVDQKQCRSIIITYNQFSKKSQMKCYATLHFERSHCFNYTLFFVFVFIFISYRTLEDTIIERKN